MKREEAILAARNQAGNNFREGYNCAESIFLAFKDLLKLDIPRDTMRLFTGFGGGIGEYGCACGALTSAIAVIGLLAGRTSVEVNTEPIYGLSGGFCRRFGEKFGATCCRILNPYTPRTTEGLRHCIKVTGNTGKLLMEYLFEQKLIQE